MPSAGRPRNRLQRAGDPSGCDGSIVACLRTMETSSASISPSTVNRGAEERTRTVAGAATEVRPSTAETGNEAVAFQARARSARLSVGPATGTTIDGPADGASDGAVA